MKFSYKILLCMIMTMALAFGVSGYLFINYVFQNSMEREVGQALNESSILQFAFETAALNIPSKYEVLQNGTIEQIGLKLESSGGEGRRLLRLSDENRLPLYASDGFVEDTDFLEQIVASTRMYRVIQRENHYYVQTGAVISSLDRAIYLETMKDVTEVFAERTGGFRVYRQMMVVVLLASSAIMLLLAHLLTRPIRILTRATKKMAKGDYSYRAKQVSNDEMGQLTRDFNRMANALEDTILKLEEEVQAREDFIGAFSHELKTPLTAIIGYADLLRSRKLDEEKAFLSANYIYTEGKRLESMAFRLLDMTVARHSRVELQEMDVAILFAYLQELHEADHESGLVFRFDYQPGRVLGEEDLLKTVLNNLVDNACKASEPGGKIEITGARTEAGYRFSVRDYGVGIAPEEIKKITQAFYMVDKSRSRSRNGAGLGLALCTEILKLHDSELEIESTVGEGSCISFTIAEAADEYEAE